MPHPPQRPSPPPQPALAEVDEGGSLAALEAMAAEMARELAMPVMCPRCFARIPAGGLPAHDLRCPGAADGGEAGRQPAAQFARVWQVQSNSGWLDCDEAVMQVIRGAEAAGRSTATYEARGFTYELDLERGVQLNLGTGHYRRIRCILDPLVGAPDDRWACRACAFQNAADDPNCDFCGADRPLGWPLSVGGRLSQDFLATGSTSDSDYEDSEETGDDSEASSEVSQPGSQAVRSFLPLHTLTREEVAKAPPERRECVICLQEYRPGDLQATLPCFHCFHRECVDLWLSHHVECPICKHNARDCGQQQVF